jgi:hypothetical protein
VEVIENKGRKIRTLGDVSEKERKSEPTASDIGVEARVYHGG